MTETCAGGVDGEFYRHRVCFGILRGVARWLLDRAGDEHVGSLRRTARDVRGFHSVGFLG